MVWMLGREVVMWESATGHASSLHGKGYGVGLIED